MEAQCDEKLNGRRGTAKNKKIKQIKRNSCFVEWPNGTQASQPMKANSHFHVAENKHNWLMMTKTKTTTKPTIGSISCSLSTLLTNWRAVLVHTNSIWPFTLSYGYIHHYLTTPRQKYICQSISGRFTNRTGQEWIHFEHVWWIQSDFKLQFSNKFNWLESHMSEWRGISHFILLLCQMVIR